MRRAPAAGLGDVDAISLLSDRKRRRLYDFVVGSGRPVSREECARVARIDRALVAYHLDKLVEHGLLEATYAHPEVRARSRTGRPPKLYRRSLREFVSSTPPRDYRLLADLLVQAADGSDPSVRRAIKKAAYSLGRSLGEETRTASGSSDDALAELLRSRGYEPYNPAGDLLRLGNCPFHAVAARHPQLVCALNLALLEGVLAGLGDDPMRAVLAPQEGCCCVAVRASTRS
jgi:predicted ArsR family transcriptional regulator